MEMEPTLLNFEVSGSKWGESQTQGTSAGVVSYSFATQNIPGQFNDFDSFITDEAFQREITESFATWENTADIRFQVAPDSADVDIRLGWGDLDGSNGVLGQATVPSFGALSGVIVIFDVAEDWFVDGDAPPDQIDFSSTAIHEIGHAIGINHSEKSQALMNASYSKTIFELQPDDKEAAISIYGESDLPKVEVYRFFNSNAGGHFFTSNRLERDIIENDNTLTIEGIGFFAVSADHSDKTDLEPVYRFLNSKSGSHLFTAFEEEKDHLLSLPDFVFEGVAFRAYSSDSSATVAVHRFFNTEIGGHFFTSNKIEMDAVLEMEQFRYEGEAFYAYSDLGI
tara:strand:+ start:921 stop:1937 length:1017 start_codon:yes stop_codon:yes gene_type:complete